MKAPSVTTVSSGHGRCRPTRIRLNSGSTFSPVLLRYYYQSSNELYCPEGIAGAWIMSDFVPQVGTLGSAGTGGESGVIGMCRLLAPCSRRLPLLARPGWILSCVQKTMPAVRPATVLSLALEPAV
jgi:hypothetical protein